MQYCTIYLQLIFLQLIFQTPDLVFGVSCNFIVTCIRTISCANNPINLAMLLLTPFANKLVSGNEFSKPIQKLAIGHKKAVRHIIRSLYFCYKVVS